RAREVERVGAVGALQRTLVRQLGEQPERPRVHTAPDPWRRVPRETRRCLAPAPSRRSAAPAWSRCRRASAPRRTTRGSRPPSDSARRVPPDRAVPRAPGPRPAGGAPWRAGAVSPGRSRQWTPLHGIQKTPEYVALELERGHRAVLVGRAREPLGDQTERVLRIAGRLLQPILEVLQTVGIHPLVMTEHRGQPLLDDQGREHLGERGGDGLEPWSRATEAHICVHREADPGEEPPLLEQLGARYSHRSAQSQPRFDAAFFTGAPVVIDDALDPLL